MSQQQQQNNSKVSYNSVRTRSVMFVIASFIVILLLMSNAVHWIYGEENSINIAIDATSEVVNAVQGKIWKPIHTRVYDGLPRLTKNDFKSLTLKKSNNVKKQCSKWVVITTIFDPTTLADQVYALPEWCGVFIGDKKSTPAKIWKDKYLGDKITFLDTNEQLTTLSYRIISHIPMNHFARKNIGYLYAIERGAKIIYDTDDDNLLKHDGQEFIKWINLMENNNNQVKNIMEIPIASRKINPYLYFGVMDKNSIPKFVWPRGFPLPHITNYSESARPTPNYIMKNHSLSEVGVVQFLADNDPDVDAIYRLTKHLPLFFTSNHLGVVIPLGSMTPFNGQATLYMHNTFWGLLLPQSVHGRVSDIWRAYFTQRIMSERGLFLMFTNPVVEQFRGDHHMFIKDFQAELPLYLQADQLVDYLWDGWNSGSSGGNELFEMIESLVIEMYEIGVLEIADVILTRCWLLDLYEMGYPIL
jgi:hypothetical protein